MSLLRQQHLFLAEFRDEKWTVRIASDENLTALQVSHFNNTARLNVFLSSFLNSYVHKLPTERTEGERMNERNEGRGGEVEIGTWRRGERINHPVRRTMPSDWKNSRGFSLFPSIFLSVCFSHHSPFFPLSLCHFSVLCRDLVEGSTLHTCVVIFWEQPINTINMLLQRRLNWYRQHFTTFPLKMEKK